MILSVSAFSSSTVPLVSVISVSDVEGEKGSSVITFILTLSRPLHSHDVSFCCYLCVCHLCQLLLHCQSAAALLSLHFSLRLKFSLLIHASDVLKSCWLIESTMLITAFTQLEIRSASIVQFNVTCALSWVSFNSSLHIAIFVSSLTLFLYQTPASIWLT